MTYPSPQEMEDDFREREVVRLTHELETLTGKKVTLDVPGTKAFVTFVCTILGFIILCLVAKLGWWILGL